MSLPPDDRIAPPPRGDFASPDTDRPEVREGFGEDDGEDEGDVRSLLADIQALIDDGRTYLEAEVTFQRTRAIFIADRAKSAAFFGAIAALFGFVALIGLTIGLIIALTPLLTAWGASALVVLLLSLLALLSARAASRRWGTLVSALGGDREGRK